MISNADGQSQNNSVNKIKDSQGNENEAILIDSRAPEHVIMDPTTFGTKGEVSHVDIRYTNRHKVIAWYKWHVTMQIGAD